MFVTNFDIALAVIDAVEKPMRAEVESKFREEFKKATGTISVNYAETLARSEALFLLHQLDLDFEGAAYLRSQLR